MQLNRAGLADKSAWEAKGYALPSFDYETVDPQFGIHKAVKSFKGYTSRILRQEFPHLKTKMPTLWTNSYFVSTVGGAPLEAVKQYIENQKTSQRQKDKMG